MTSFRANTYYKDFIYSHQMFIGLIQMPISLNSFKFAFSVGNFGIFRKSEKNLSMSKIRNVIQRKCWVILQNFINIIKCFCFTSETIWGKVKKGFCLILFLHNDWFGNHLIDDIDSFYLQFVIITVNMTIKLKSKFQNSNLSLNNKS